MTKAAEMRETYMGVALEEARKAGALGEVPVGAVVVDKATGAVIASGYNRRETDKSVTAHAEMLAIEAACRQRDDWRLSGCALYVTLEPCPMCAGALVNCRIDEVVFGAFDPAAGCCGSVVHLFELGLPFRPKVQGGVRRAECEELLRAFFTDLREKPL